MTRRRLLWAFLGLGGLLILLIMVGGAFIYLRGRSIPTQAEVASPVLVFIRAPNSGFDLEVGSRVAVTVQADAPSAITEVEFFVNGEPHGTIAEPDELTTWSWLAWPAGIHQLSARAVSADGHIGQSKAVILNVLSGEGPFEVAAGEDQTLAQIGDAFDLSPEQMAQANPDLPSSEPLAPGVRVRIPASGSDPASEEPAGQPAPTSRASTGRPSIRWQFEPSEPVDLSYCYFSAGGDRWQKIPAAPFQYFQGADPIQYDIAPSRLAGSTVQAECWGWLGGTLKFLGQGEAEFQDQQSDEVVINGSEFILTGLPQDLPEFSLTGGGGQQLTLPAPFALREPADAADCTDHSGSPLLAAFICEELMNASLQRYRVLEWEWEPKNNWPGYETWSNEVDRYVLYQIEPATNKGIYLKEITNPNQKLTAVPLPWGYFCYSLKAYSDNPMVSGSEAAFYCPGEPPEPESTILKPRNWLTSGGRWTQKGSCDWHGSGDAYLLANQNEGFGNNGEVLVGSYVVADDDQDCYRQGNYSGAVLFDKASLPPNAVLAKAVLSFDELKTDFGADGVAGNLAEFCVASVSTARQDWTGMVEANHFVSGNVLATESYNNEYQSLPGGSGQSLDVTPIVASWLDHPADDHGFILNPKAAPSPAVDGSGSCQSFIGGFELELTYFQQ